MTAAEYQAAFTQQAANGFYPICVQGGGVGRPDTLRGYLCAERHSPSPVCWRVTGAPVPALAGFDQIMKTFMQANGVRAAQLTIGKDGDIKLARAYTWAESGYRRTQISDVFLLASLSKMFTEAAIQSLYDSWQVDPNNNRVSAARPFGACRSAQ